LTQANEKLLHIFLVMLFSQLFCNFYGQLIHYKVVVPIKTLDFVVLEQKVNYPMDHIDVASKLLWKKKIYSTTTIVDRGIFKSTHKCGQIVVARNVELWFHLVEVWLSQS